MDFSRIFDEQAALDKLTSKETSKCNALMGVDGTNKQVEKLMKEYQGEPHPDRQTDYKALCNALTDAINQKTSIIHSQHMANKVLIERISDLEKKMEKMTLNRSDKGCSKEKVFSELLFEGYIAPMGPMSQNSEDDILENPKILSLIQHSINPLSSDSSNRTACVSEDDDVKTGGSNSSICRGNSFENSAGGASENDLEHTDLQEYGTDIETHEGSSPKNIHIKDGKMKNTLMSEEMLLHESKYTSDYTSKQSEVLLRMPSLSNESSESESQRNSIQDDYKSGSNSVMVNPEDDLEDIVPICELDDYLKQVRQKNWKSSVVVEENSVVKDDHDCIHENDKVPGNFTTLNKNTAEQLSQDQGFSRDLTNCSSPSEFSASRNSSNDSHSNTQSLPVVDSLPVEEEPLNGSSSRPSHEISNFKPIRMENTLKRPFPLTAQKAKENSTGSGSFELDLSDYDSDNDNLDAALQEWQNEFDKMSKYQSSPKKESKKKAGLKRLWSSKAKDNEYSDSLDHLFE